jgi:beta-N-acetylhexosaminidase
MVNTMEKRIGQMLMVGFDGVTAPDYILEWLARGQVGGIILFARNVQSPAQLADLCRTLHAAAASNPDNPPLLISIDQEGGTVARLRETTGFTESPGAMALAAGMLGKSGGAELAEAVSEMLAVEMRAVGINWTLAPVVDTMHDTTNPTMGTRSPGSDAAVVAQIAVAGVRGFQRGGVAAAVKHFPGLGNTPVDTHLALAVIAGAVDYLWEHDLVPFRAAVDAGARAVMVSHVLFEALDSVYPATLSPAISTALLRDDVGFTGVACTDCMEMKAIADHWGAGESAVLAALAGIDIILFSHTRAMQQDAYDALLEAARTGRLSPERIDQALDRITALKRAVALDPAGIEPASVFSAAHRQVARDAAWAGLVLYKDGGDLPVSADVTLIEFASWLDSQAMERGELSDLARLAQEAGLSAPISLYQRDLAHDADPAPLNHARDAASNAKTLALFTRSAHINAAQMAAARELIDSVHQRGGRAILIALRNPYDAGTFSDADTILCANGDSAPSVAAALAALRGVFKPDGALTVEIRV